MKLEINSNSKVNGANAAKCVAKLLNKAIAANGEARLLVSTGASQFEMFEKLIKLDIDWSKIEVFHLDEYVGLPYNHPASFRKYLTERFVNHIPLKKMNFVNGEGDVCAMIKELTAAINAKPIDVGIIGIGVNAHIAFNDPPANFDTDEAYIVVELDEKCKMQQVGEGWFATLDDVPKTAITMSVKQIMKCKTIVSVVPHAVKAEAVYNTMTQPVNNMVPATMLKAHDDWRLYIDYNSAKLIYNLD